MATHAQTWVKVNAMVDADVAELVAILNTVDGLETLQSCQGDPGGRNGYIYFALGDWRKLCHFVFQTIGPNLKNHADDDVTLTVEVTSADSPMGKLGFKAEAIGTIVSALKEVLR
jgi:hypothetical protein